MRPGAFNGAAHPFDGLDHLWLGDFQQLIGLGIGGIKRRAFAGVEPMNGGQRPMRQGGIGHCRDHQGGVTQ